MSIFSAKDAEVNILTQLCQLQFDPEKLIHSELDEWIFRYRGNFWKEFQGNQTQGQIRYVSDEGKHGEAELHSVAELYPLIHKIMEYMALDIEIKDLASIPYEEAKPEDYAQEDQRSEFNDCIKTINKLAEKIHVSLVPEDPSLREYDQDYPVRKFYGPYLGYHNKDWTMPAHYSVIVALLEVLPKGRKSFLRCLTCNSVFVVGRSNQVRCSRRCNARENARKRILEEELTAMRGKTPLPISEADWTAAEMAAIARRKK